VLTADVLVAGYDRRRPVLDGFGLTVPAGQTIGLAGPSGCGKSTFARVLALLHKPFAGSVHIDGTLVTAYRHRAPRELRTRIGVLFQQPRLSIDPRMTLRTAIAEPLRAAKQSVDRVDELADLVMLTQDLLSRRAHEVSDGQLQRACLARALALRPGYLLCDEMTTMLDASTTAALVSVIGDEVARGLGVLTVSHDEPLLAAWADEVLRPWGAQRTPVTGASAHP
jgi:peptide/nickel transport system ATP-binding protein